MMMILGCVDASAQKWTALPAPSEIPNYGAFFTDSLNGVITNWRFDFSGTGAEIYRTQNGGASWSQVFSSTGALFAVAFADRDNGTAVGGDPECTCGGIYRTTNGGASWTLQQTVSDASPSLYAVQYVNSQVGFIGGDDGALLKTTNGGLSWTKLSTGTSGVFRNIQFVDPDNGFAIVAEPENSLQGERFFKTTDGGATWKSIGFNNFVPEVVWFTSPTVGFIGGNGGRPVILKTTDGGATWSEKYRSLGSSNFILSMQFVNPYVGYAVGGNPNFGQATSGVIVSTTDGGETWSAEESSYQHTLRWVHFPTEKVGYVVGEGGTVLKTSRKLFDQPMPAIKLNREALDFGSQQIGESRTLTVDISPQNIAGLRVDSVLLGGVGAASYTMTISKPLPHELRSGEKLTVSVTFTPAEAGASGAELTIKTNDAESAEKKIMLTGSGSAAPEPAAAISADTVRFGEVNLGSSKSMQVTIAPANSAGLAIDSVYLDGVAIADLTITTSPSIPATLAAGEEMTVTITYMPKGVAGTLDGALVVESNDAAASEIRVPLTGRGRSAASAPRAIAGDDASVEALIEPNPAGDRAALRLKLAHGGALRVELFDDRGALAHALPERMVEAGERVIDIDTRMLAAGIYHCRVQIDGAAAVTRLVVVR